MKKEKRKEIMFRYALIAICLVIFSGLITAKMIKTTIIEVEGWNKKAERELSSIDTIQPIRGNILAADGSILATNVTNYAVRLDFRSDRFMEDRYIMALDSLSDSLATYFPIRTKQEWKRYLEEPLSKPKDKRSRVFTLVHNVTYSDYLKLCTFPFLNIKNRNKNGLVKDELYRRNYPYGAMARRSIGRVAYPDTISKEQHGISGLEMSLDSLLFGQVGIARKAVVTRDLVNWTDIPAINGYDVRTTIDIKMQDIAENELNRMLSTNHADWGCVVLMEVATGDIKAISNLERKITKNNDTIYVEAMNRAIQGIEPGSVIKTLSMLIALEDGFVTDLDQVYNTAPYNYARCGTITDCDRTTNKPIREFLERSSNVGMTKLMAPHFEKNPIAFRQRVEQLGLLELFNIGIAGERIPRISETMFNVKAGGLGNMARMFYGYALEFPPLYTLALYNAIANDGKFVRPRLYSEYSRDGVVTENPVSYVRDSICSVKNARILQDLLKRVVWGPAGTARNYVKSDIVSIAGKTGSGYVANVIQKQYDANGNEITLTDKERRQLGGYGKKLNYTFCGFFPTEAPKYSCVVVISNPRRPPMSAASASGVVLKNIALNLHARGLLGNESDYRENPAENSTPVFYSSVEGGEYNGVCADFGITSSSSFAAPQTCSQGVPDVTGLGLRDAVSTLEQAGYNVTFSDNKYTGYVVRQEPRHGTELPSGETVALTLSLTK